MGVAVDFGLLSNQTPFSRYKYTSHTGGLPHLYLSPAVKHIKRELTTYPNIIEVQSAGAWSSDAKFHLLFSNLKPRCVSFHRKTSDTFVALKQLNIKILSKTAAVFFKDIKSFDLTFPNPYLMSCFKYSFL